MADMLRAAGDEMSEAAAYYEDQGSGVGHRFLNRVQLTVARIEALPTIGTPCSPQHPGVRQLAVKGFPYYIVYTTEPVLTIVAVAHMKRRPGYWKNRLPQ